MTKRATKTANIKIEPITPQLQSTSGKKFANIFKYNFFVYNANLQIKILNKMIFVILKYYVKIFKNTI